jgi:hypothetical protein
MAKQVTREQFLHHLQQLIAGATDEPCTLKTSLPVYDRTNNMQPAGTGSISYFVDHTPDWLIREQYEQAGKGKWLPAPRDGEDYSHYRARVRTRHVECNHTTAGLKYMATSFAQECQVIEEEERLARRDEEQISYFIGEKIDRYGIGMQGDQPGIDFNLSGK